MNQQDTGLDLGGAPITPPAAVPPVPIDVTGPDLVLSPPAAVPVIEQDRAATLLPLDEPTVAALQARADAFVADLVAVDHRSPEFTQKIAAISSMGERESREAAGVSNRMLQRPASALAGSRGRRGHGPGGDTQVKVAGSLSQLRHTVQELDPARANLTGGRRLLRNAPGSGALRRYFQRYQSAQAQLDAIIGALASGQDELRKDNADIETERRSLWALMNRLQEYATLAQALDTAAQGRADELRAAGQTEQADAVVSEAVFPIRQRHQDILTEFAVAAQAYLALDLVRKNNLELIKGVERAQTTTVAALRTAVIVAQALANQKLVLDQINALNATTSSMIESTSALLRQQGAAVHQQASQAAVSVESLQRAFDNVFATMDAIDSYKLQATEQMSHTVAALEGQLQRARPYLERARRETSASDRPEIGRA